MMLSEQDRRDIQGIITTGFGHLDHAGFLLLDLRDAEGGRTWVRTILPQVTTAAPWSKDETGRKRRPECTINVALAYHALEILGLPVEARNTLPTEYVVGMASRCEINGDRGKSAPPTWEFSAPGLDPAADADSEPSRGGGAQFNVLVVVYARSEGAVDEVLDDLRTSIGPDKGVVEVGLERGAENTSFKEHFGFSADGISQPLIQGVRSEHAEPGPWVVRTGEFILGYINELGLYPPSPGVAVEHDPHGILPRFPEGALPGFKDFGRNGSYLVYRKLYQDVAGFWQFIQAATPPRSGGQAQLEADMVAVAAKFMGRWPSGAPLVLTPDHDDPALGHENDFMYRPTDPVGFACPIGAHIRRANPRDAIRRISDTAEESLATSNQHRVLRRGLNYGEPLFPKHEVENGQAPVDLQDDGQPRGLHFIAVNADIQRQFEFIQETWLNNQKFNGLYDNKDGLIGDNDGTGTMVVQRSPIRRHVEKVPRFVEVRGGGYFFLPSITALRFLGGPE